MTNDTITKKYKLKPGLHQFAPGSAAVHCNDNLRDEEAEWYLQRYPHIAKLFDPFIPEVGVMKQTDNKCKTKAEDTLDKGGSV